MIEFDSGVVYMIVDLNLIGKRVLVVGGGSESSRKVEALLSQQCKIFVVAEKAEQSIKNYADEGKLSDKKGHVLPDLILLKDGATVKDLANEIHTGLSKGLLHAKDLRYNLRLPTHYQLRDRDVISLVSATKKSTG